MTGSVDEGDSWKYDELRERVRMDENVSDDGRKRLMWMMWNRQVMNGVLAGFDRRKVTLFVDDILIVSETVKENMELPEKVLDCLEEVGVKVKLEKCRWLAGEVEFLGHMVSASGVKKSEKFVKKFIPSTSTPPIVPVLRVEMGTQTEVSPIEEKDMQTETPSIAPVFDVEAGTQTEEITVPRRDIKTQTYKRHPSVIGDTQTDVILVGDFTTNYGVVSNIGVFCVCNSATSTEAYTTMRIDTHLNP
ncbi:uncharacterized protein LOC135198266 [Macrobrachium nipponense]|uniref:uncharacterized protein LOC135198266 n=1 Tax=Macrobrachium nipponense TaxID=159736 RepID=UPI0030C7D8A1